jgi:hypothetical protein
LQLLILARLQPENPARITASASVREIAPMPDIHTFLPPGFTDFIDFPRQNPDWLRRGGGAAAPLRWGLYVIKIEQ